MLFQLGPRIGHRRPWWKILLPAVGARRIVIQNLSLFKLIDQFDSYPGFGRLLLYLHHQVFLENSLVKN